MNSELETSRDDDFEDDPLSDRICQFCSYFLHHEKDDDNMGICSLDEDLIPCLEDDSVMENMDFSCCRELYLKKCFDGIREGCEAFESSKIDLPEGMSIETYLHLEAIRDADTSDLFLHLNQEDREDELSRLEQIGYFVLNGNREAYTNLIRYCQELGPATTLEEVGFRIKLVEFLSSMPRSSYMVDVYIQELARTPSNTKTRKLYTKILEVLGRYPQEVICAPLEELLDQVPYSYKIKRRIKEVAGLVEAEGTGWF